ncbi:hypothetical protein MMC29_005941 [Sticta canariensis]|nr:hypothetical protein [Sticta canariensis]
MGDGVTFLERTGRLDSFQYRGQSPWGPGRHVKLVELLQQWTELVEKGVLGVGYNGVKGGEEWFDVQHANAQQLLDGPKGWEEGNPWREDDFGMIGMHQNSGSGTFWGWEDEKAHSGGIFKGICLRQSCEQQNPKFQFSA